MVVSCCNHVSHVRSSASSSLTLSRVPLSCWILVPHTVTSLPRSPFNYPFKLPQVFPFQAPQVLGHLLGTVVVGWCLLSHPRNPLILHWGHDGSPVFFFFMFDSLSNLFFRDSWSLCGREFSAAHLAKLDATTAQWLAPSGSFCSTMSITAEISSLD